MSVVSNPNIGHMPTTVINIFDAWLRYPISSYPSNSEHSPCFGVTCPSSPYSRPNGVLILTEKINQDPWLSRLRAVCPELESELVDVLTYDLSFQCMEKVTIKSNCLHLGSSKRHLDRVVTVSLWGWIALALAAVGVIGSVIPLIPGAVVSLSGVLTYWWASGFTDPQVGIVAVLLLVGISTAVVDFAGGALAAHIGGASTITTGVAVVVGIGLLFITGPAGFLIGLAGTVFVVEFAQSADSEASIRAALAATGGVLASTVIQVMMTSGMFLTLVIIIVI